MTTEGENTASGAPWWGRRRTFTALNMFKHAWPNGVGWGAVDETAGAQTRRLVETGSEKIRTLIFTYQASDQDAEVFTVVLGSVAENFRGIELHEVVDETVLGDGDDRGAIDALYKTLTKEGRLTPEQREQLEAFGDSLRDWAGEI